MSPAQIPLRDDLRVLELLDEAVRWMPVDSKSAKLVIDFAGGRRTLLGRFVEMLE